MVIVKVMSLNISNPSWKIIKSYTLVPARSSTLIFKVFHSNVHNVLLKEENPSESISGPVDELNYRIAKGEILSDEHQIRITQQLQRVYTDIKNYQPVKQGLISKWFGKAEKQKGPNGLYLYGTVGCGKTMLMDLFYNCCKVSLMLLFSS